MSMSENKILSGDEIYDILQDKNGYIWLATSYGVIKYNGYQSKLYTTVNGLVSNSIIKLYEDSRGNIWFISHRKGLSIYNGKEIRGHYLNPRIVSLIFPGIIENMHVDSTGNIFLARNLGGIFKISKSGSIEQVESTQKHGENFRIYTYTGQDFLVDYQPNSTVNQQYLFEKDALSMKIYWNGEFSPITRKKFIKLSEKEYYFSVGTQIIHIINDKIEETAQFNHEITDIALDNENRLWLSTLYDGVFVYKNNSLKSEYQHFLKSKSISRVLFDRNKHIWFTTLGHGVLLAQNTLIQILAPADRTDFVIRNFSMNADHIFMNTQEQEIWRFTIKNNTFSLIYKPLNKNENFKDLALQNKYLYLLGSGFVQMSEQGKISNREELSGRRLEQGNNGDLYLLLFNHIQKRTKKDNTHFLFWDNPLIYPTSLVAENENKIWVGTNEGLYLYSNDSLENMAYKNSFFNNHVTDLRLCQNRLFIAANGEGLGLWANDSLIKINQNNGLSSNFINSITCQNDSIIWTANNNGLNRIIFSKDSFSIYKFHQDNGMYLSNLKKICYKNDALWIASSKGLYKIEQPEKLEIISEPIVLIDSIRLNLKPIKYDKRLVLNAEDELEFYFQTIEYINPNGIQLVYRINKGPSKSIYGNSLKLEKLTHGNYTYTIGIHQDGDFLPLFEYKILVNEEYTESIYFRLSILAILITIIILSFKISMQYYRKKAASKENYLRNKQKALVSQLNPDFFYQSIDTMRHLLSKGKISETQTYLSHFHALLQGIIPSTNFNLVQLEKELELIVYYLNMVSLRYKKSFESEINCSMLENHQDIYIPPILALALVDAYIVNINPLLKHKIIITAEIKDKYCYFSVNLMQYGGTLPSFFISNNRLAFIEKRISLVKTLIKMPISLEFDLKEDRNNHYISEKRTLVIPANWRTFEKKGSMRWWKFDNIPSA